jgi:Predicted metal-dependent hydrolase with the TIM-barrel fold
MAKYQRSKYSSTTARLIAVMLVVSYLCGMVYAADDQIAATVYKNGIIYTVAGGDWDKNAQESVAVAKDGTILYIGSDEGANAYIGAGTKVVDLGGLVVFPGFLDGHVHPPGAALTELYNIYLYEAITKENTLALIKAYIEANPELDAYWGSGFSMGIGGADSEGKGPKKEWLDEICSDKPIILSSNDGHNRWLNSKALELNGITDSTVHPTGTVQKSADGKLWGTLTDARSLITMTQTFTDSQQKSALEYFQQNMHGWGFTGGLMLSGTTNAGYLRELETEGRWKMHSNLAFTFSPGSSYDEYLTTFMNFKESLGDNKLVNLTTAKFFMDGVIEGMTGYLSEPYDAAAGLDSDYVSVPLWDSEDLMVHFSDLMNNGIQIHVHSIGDQATSDVIDAMAVAQKNNPAFDARNTITHLQVVMDSDKVRMGELGIIGSTQPFWHMKEPEWFEYVDKVALGADRAWKEYPVKSMIDAGVTVTFSGDHPVSPINNPFWAIETAVTRNLNNAEFYGVDDITSIDDLTWLLNPDERISAKQAIEAYTINVARQMFMEDSIGSLAVGKIADMIVVDQDPLKINPLDIDKTEVVATIFAGEIVYGGIVEKEIFDDIANHWAKDAIIYVYDVSLFKGLSASLFCPEGTMTRAMAVTVLHRIAELPEPKGAADTFADVIPGMWYEEAVKWTAESGIVNGYGEGLFGPEDNVTREQMVTLLWRYFNWKELDVSVGEDTNILSYADAFAVSEYAVASMQWACGEDLISGKPGGYLDPQGKITRAEVAEILMRMLVNTK